MQNTNADTESQSYVIPIEDLSDKWGLGVPAPAEETLLNPVYLSCPTIVINVKEE